MFLVLRYVVEHGRCIAHNEGGDHKKVLPSADNMRFVMLFFDLNSEKSDS